METVGLQMSNWRAGSWDALALGQHGDPRWPQYGEYARLRTAGLRSEALAAADQCAANLASADDAMRWEFTAWLCTEMLGPGVTRSMVLPHPLEGIVLGALWEANDRGEARATAWLVQWFPVQVMAHLENITDAIGEFLRRAVIAQPMDGSLRSLLAEHLVAWVRQDTADLAKGRYDGDPSADLQRLAEADTLLEAGSPVRVEVERLRRIVSDWISRHP